MCRKILLIATTPLNKDGLTKIELDIVEYNSDIKWSVACSSGFDNAYGNRLLDLGVRCVNLPPKNSVLRYMKAIYMDVKDQKYDAVYIHGNSAVMLREALPAKVAGAKRIITHCHNTKSDFPLLHYVAKPFLSLIVDRKIGCSFMAAKWSCFGKNVYVIENGIETDKFEFNQTLRDQIRADFGWDDMFIIGHVGRFNKQKNHLKIVNVFEEIHKKNKNIRLLLIGDGELKTEIISLVCNKKLDSFVKFIGTTDRVMDYYNAMDMVLMPSLFEGLGIVALEAQRNGVPIVISDKLPPEAIVANNIYAISLSKSDKEWADIILNHLDISRKDNANLFKNSVYDMNTMMIRVRSILIDD